MSDVRKPAASNHHNAAGNACKQTQKLCLRQNEILESLNVVLAVAERHEQRPLDATVAQHKLGVPAHATDT
jgi:hypothetical protein